MDDRLNTFAIIRNKLVLNNNNINCIDWLVTEHNISKEKLPNIVIGSISDDKIELFNSNNDSVNMENIPVTVFKDILNRYYRLYNKSTVKVYNHTEFMGEFPV